jgi:hypothetical protein
MLPRPVLPRQFYLITRRCTQRQLLLRPDRETNNAFTYCLIEAAQRYGIGRDPTRVSFRRLAPRSTARSRPHVVRVSDMLGALPPNPLSTPNLEAAG